MVGYFLLCLPRRCKVQQMKKLLALLSVILFAKQASAYGLFKSQLILQAYQTFTFVVCSKK